MLPAVPGRCGGDVLHGTITLDTSLPDSNASPDIGQHNATSGPSAMTVTIGPNGPFPQETYSTSSLSVRIAENGGAGFSDRGDLHHQ
jgi:hypothetical protein